LSKYFNKETKYYRWYKSIITTALERERPDEYFEIHHIIPRSFGGNNRYYNLVNLTFREHFLVHWILTKICKHTNHKHAMLRAFSCFTMTGKAAQRNLVSWRYDLAKIAARGIPKPEGFGSHNTARLLGTHRTQEQKDYHSRMLTGRIRIVSPDRTQMRSVSPKKARKFLEKGWTEGTLYSLPGEKNGMFGKNHTDESREKMTEAVRQRHIDSGDFKVTDGTTIYPTAGEAWRQTDLHKKIHIHTFRRWVRLKKHGWSKV
jgi:hypothetical protein